MPAPRERHETIRDTIDVAAGRRPADLLVRQGRWVNVCSGEILDGTDVAVVSGRIAYCGPSFEGLVGRDTQVLDACGRFLVPGLLDAHVHVESSMLTPERFAETVVPRGTTGVFVDPHEIANVLGLDGIRLFVDASPGLPLGIYVQVPSCVPAAAAVETGGARLGPAEVDEALSWPGVIGLGEVMDFPGVAAGREELCAKVAAAVRRGAVVGGHYASEDLGRPFHAYVAAGISDDHEGRRAEDVRARVRQGMYAMLRHGTAWRDLERQVPAIADDAIDARRVLLCTDDRDVGSLLGEGHMDAVVRAAIAAGVAPMTALQMATLNTAEHFGLANEIGCIAPGRRADLFLVDNLEELVADEVIVGGRLVAAGGALCRETAAPARVPPAARGSVHLTRPLTAEALLPRPPADGRHTARLVRIREDDVVTDAATVDVTVSAGRLEIPEAADICHLAVVERHGVSGRIGHGLVQGFGITRPCAVASTVAHDSHNLIVLGTTGQLMAEAAGRAAAISGGLCFVGEAGESVELPLPVAGLMSDRAPEEVAAGLRRIEEALRACGCRLRAAVMTLSFLALPVIPALRLTDLGLVDVAAQRLVSLFVAPDNPKG